MSSAVTSRCIYCLDNVDSRATIAAMDPYYDPPGVAVELHTFEGHLIPARTGTTWPRTIFGWLTDASQDASLQAKQERHREDPRRS
jgi:hypothetical protein